jgi:RNA methyltransferase, TrmH family
VVKGTLTTEGFCIAEGFHTVEEAFRSGCEVGEVLVAESVGDAADRLGHRKAITVPDRLFRSISSTGSPQGVMALVRPPPLPTEETFFKGRPLVIVMDGIQDPGNAGAVLRSAEAFGATGVMFLKGSVWPFNPKAVRASAGSVFRVPMLFDRAPEEVPPLFRRWATHLYSAMPRAQLAVTEVDLSRPSAFVIGAEGRGISRELVEVSTPIHVPTREVESLNAAVAAAILAYEASRQRSGQT